MGSKPDDLPWAGRGRQTIVAPAPDRLTYALLADLAVKLTSTGDVTEILRIIVSDAPAVVDADTAQVSLVDPMDRVVPVPPETGRDLSEHVAVEVPLALSDRGGEPLGLLTFGWYRPVEVDEERRTALNLVAGLCAGSLVRARLTARTDEVAQLATALAGATSGVDVALALSEQGQRALGAALVTLRVLDPATGTLDSLLGVPLPGHLDAPYRRVSLDVDNPGAAAIRANEAIWIADTAELGTRRAEAGDPAAWGYPSVAALPVRAADGAPIAVIGLAWAKRTSLDEYLRRSALAVARVAGPALERALIYDVEHAAVATMQRRLLGRPAKVAGLTIAVRYQPGERASGMGGDWYDTIVCPDGSLVVVIGDVAGHGVDAVAGMAQLQYLVAGLIRTGRPLRRVLAEVSGALGDHGTPFATAALYHIEPRRHRLGYLSAGHPWALIRRPNGRVERLDGAQRAAIGVIDGADRLAHARFDPGSLLIAYSDGLVKREGHRIIDRVNRLASLLATVDPRDDLDELLAWITTESRRRDDAGQPPDDDVTAVLVRI